MAAEIKEVVVNAEPVGLQRLRPDGGERSFFAVRGSADSVVGSACPAAALQRENPARIAEREIVQHIREPRLRERRNIVEE